MSVEYKWIFSPISQGNPPIYQLQDILRKLDILFAVTFEDDQLILKIRIPNPSSPPGRPHTPVSPENDLTLEQILHMRFMNIPMREIAKRLGVSVRTLYRRFEGIQGKNLDPTTPFSLW